MRPTYAGFWIRAGATFIDAILMVIVFTIPTMMIYGAEEMNNGAIIHGFWDLLINWILPFVVIIWLWVRFYGTPGKMATKLKIVDARTGYKLSVFQAVIRYFAYIVSALPLGLGFIWIGFDPKKQGWHDKIAGTVVIRDNNPDEVTFEENR
ncbi:RDD family protein [Thiomicrorhabdus xiamenensis]|uniref:RDD family protein n=1 Tax=Thiomicrorhabdus xiamenensis TaxID=2739063 RepID=A0A7D4NJJ4_9GAMM|nr:RDD family protein [Thiomicrorhabdus xiamenensis]QKI88329.1 RDD family protein [Thiomicrorhabdus xiamenensis]